MVAVADTGSVQTILRDAEDADLHFVVETWRHSYRLSNRWRKAPGHGYHAHFDKIVIHGLLSDPETRLRLLVLQDAPDTIAAWLCHTPGLIPIVHYGYTRPRLDEGGPRWRRCGIFRLMLADAGVRPGTAAAPGGMVYTMRPQERPHRQGRALHLEDSLLAAAAREGVTPIWRPVENYLSDLRRR